MKRGNKGKKQNQNKNKTKLKNTFPKLLIININK